MRKGELDGVNLGRFEGVEAIFLPSFGAEDSQNESHKYSREIYSRVVILEPCLDR